MDLPSDLRAVIIEYLWDDILDLYRASHRQLFTHILSQLCPKADMEELFRYFHYTNADDQRGLIDCMYSRYGFRIFHWYMDMNLLECAYDQCTCQAWNHMRYHLGARYSNVSKYGFCIDKYTQGGRPWHLEQYR